MPFTQLQAVNRILRRGGSSPVSALGTGSDSANTALQTLDDAIRSLQIQTQVFNTVRATLIPNGSNKIPVGSGWIAVDGRAETSDDPQTTTTNTIPNNGINVGAAGGGVGVADEDLNITIRAGFIYNLRDDTNLFTKNILVWITKEFVYDDCPSHVQEYATAMAIREFQDIQLGDPVTDASLARKEEEARQEYNRRETLQADANHFKRFGNTTLLTVGARRVRQAPNSVIPGSR